MAIVALEAVLVGLSGSFAKGWKWIGEDLEVSGSFGGHVMPVEVPRSSTSNPMSPAFFARMARRVGFDLNMWHAVHARP